VPAAIAWVREHPAARLLVLLPIAAAVYARDPAVFHAPRFWAEEGSHYFRNAMTTDWVRGLVQPTAPEHAPYVHPLPQLATWAAAHFVPLAQAPLVTTAAWVTVVLALVAVGLYGRAELLHGPHRRLLVLAAPLLAISNCENWANTLGAHLWADFAILLLALEAEHVTGKRRSVGLAGFTALALLSPSSWMMLPAVVVLCAHRWRPHRAYLVGLASAVALHLALIVVALPTRARNPASISEAAHLIVSKLVIWPLAGPELADGYAKLALALAPVDFQLLGYALAVALVGLLIAFGRMSRRDPTTSALLWTYLAATASFVLLGLHVGRDLLPLFHGARYTWLPNALLILLLGHQLDAQQLRARKPSQLVLAAALAASLVVGVSQYRYPLAIRSWSRAPDWRAEVERYEQLTDQTSLGIAPSGWKIELPPRLP
jgi:hypothetical protein